MQAIPIPASLRVAPSSIGVFDSSSTAVQHVLSTGGPGKATVPYTVPLAHRPTAIPRHNMALAEALTELEGLQFPEIEASDVERLRQFVETSGGLPIERDCRSKEILAVGDDDMRETVLPLCRWVIGLTTRLEGRRGARITPSLRHTVVKFVTTNSLTGRTVVKRVPSTAVLARMCCSANVHTRRRSLVYMRTLFIGRVRTEVFRQLSLHLHVSAATGTRTLPCVDCGHNMLRSAQSLLFSTQLSKTQQLVVTSAPNMACVDPCRVRPLLPGETHE